MNVIATKVSLTGVKGLIVVIYIVKWLMNISNYMKKVADHLSLWCAFGVCEDWLNSVEGILRIVYYAFRNLIVQESYFEKNKY